MSDTRFIPGSPGCYAHFTVPHPNGDDTYCNFPIVGYFHVSNPDDFEDDSYVAAYLDRFGYVRPVSELPHDNWEFDGVSWSDEPITRGA